MCCAFASRHACSEGADALVFEEAYSLHASRMLVWFQNTHYTTYMLMRHESLLITYPAGDSCEGGSQQWHRHACCSRVQVG